MISFTTIVISVVCILFAYYFLNRRDKKSPPGPWGLPILGNLLSLQPQLHVSFEKFGKQYGKIVSVRLGAVRAIVLHDLKVIREAFNLQAFSGRPDVKLFNFVAGGKHGIVNSDGQEWVEQRRFTLRALRDFGFGKKSMESLIMDEVSDVLIWIKKNEGKPVSPNKKFSLAVVNALFTIMTGKRYDQDDPMLKNILDTGAESIGEASKSAVLWFLPKLATIMPWYFGWDKLTSILTPFIKFFEDIVQDHVKAGHSVENSEPADFTEAYLQEIKNTTDPNSSFYKEKGLQSLLAVITDLYGAGSGTSTANLAWLILYVMRYPEVQAKLQAELDSVTGKTRSPCLADRPNTPYVQAVIQETLRISSIVPFGVFHYTMEDVEFHGYLIPKDTVIIPNLHAVNHDPEIWGDPENFRPERFLSEDGKTFTKNDAMLAFSVGKRVCVGEIFARDQIYLFLTNVFAKYQVLPDPSDPKPSLAPDGSVILEPKPYTVIFKER